MTPLEYLCLGVALGAAFLSGLCVGGWYVIQKLTDRLAMVNA